MKKGQVVYIFDKKDDNHPDRIVCTKIEKVKVEIIDGEEQAPQYEICMYHAALPEFVNGEELFSTKESLVEHLKKQAIEELEKHYSKEFSIYYSEFKNGVNDEK